MGRSTPLLLVGLLGISSSAWAQNGVPDRQIPPSVLGELRILEDRFDNALSADCDARRCFSKGCAYVDHAVADRPRATSLPGLSQDPGPGSVAPQEYLTAARCSFAHEDSVEATDVSALTRRLQSKLSGGWLVVSVGHQALQPLPPHLQKPPEPEVDPDLEAATVVEEPEAFSAVTAGRELWTSLLPHFWWMIAVGMVTVAGATLIWAWRRVGRESLEERALLAELERGEGEHVNGDALATGSPAEDEDDAAFVAKQGAVWTLRLEAVGPDAPDPQLQAMIHALLRAGELPLLAKAVLRFPATFPAAFPAGGDIATAKLELSDYLKDVDVDALPSDADFFRSLNRHALSAALASQSDAQIVSSLRKDFGASGLATLIAGLHSRAGALLFALAPANEQHELVRLLTPSQKAELADQLLRSNRMDPAETTYLFSVLEAARGDQPMPPLTLNGEVSDRGAAFDATGALSVLLPGVNPAQRGALFDRSLQRFHGSLPAWYRGIFVADMLFALPHEARADLLLEVNADALAAWLSLLDEDTTERLMGPMPAALRASVAAASVFPSRTRQLSMAERGRRDLARGFQEQLARANVPFEQVVLPRQPAPGP